MLGTWIYCVYVGFIWKSMISQSMRNRSNLQKKENMKKETVLSLEFHFDDQVRLAKALNPLISLCIVECYLPSSSCSYSLYRTLSLRCLRHESLSCTRGMSASRGRLLLLYVDLLHTIVQ
ncbi:hypothetical protein ACOSQ3_017847 [Xanthoceras sorbifolium]